MPARTLVLLPLEPIDEAPSNIMISCIAPTIDWMDTHAHRRVAIGTRIAPAGRGCTR
jgi:hypothetical protein